MPSNRIILLKGDITEMDVDAIVNSANTELWLGSGVAGAILSRGGKSIEDEAVKLGPIEPGEVVITLGGSLKAAHVIHAAAMRPGEPASVNSITKATKNVFKIARDRKIKSVAFPALGAGAGGVSMPHCARAMLIEAVNFLDENEYPKSVYFVLFDIESLKHFQSVFDNLEE
ncbi:macro domain-containing protein [bacterium]|nr:macro domain-containing protein [bacterium]